MSNVVAPNTADTDVRIAAAGFVRSASDIVPAVIAHLIGQGITDFYLAMHNEDPEVSRALVAALGSRANFTIFHHEHPVFNQPALSQMMMTQARREGFDIYVPFDTDEFYVAPNPTSTVAAQLTRWYRSETTEQLLVPNRNFLAPRDIEDFVIRDLARLRHRLEYKAHVRYPDMQRRLESMLKSVVRLSNVPDGEFASTITGNHRTYRGRRVLSYAPPRVPLDFDVVILHVPYRSRNTSVNPVLLNRAIDSTGRPRHEYNESEFAELFRQIWEATSVGADEYASSHIDRGDYELFADDSFARVVDGIVKAGFDIDHPWCASTHTETDAVFSSRIFINDPIFDTAIMAITAHVHRVNEEWAARGAAKRRAKAFRIDAKNRIARLRQANERLRSANERLSLRITAVTTPASPRRQGALQWTRRAVGAVLRRLTMRRRPSTPEEKN